MNHLGNLLTTLKNSQYRKKDSIRVQYTKLIESVCKILKDRNFISDYEIVEDKFKYISVKMKYDEKKEPAISVAKLVSKPGVRKYISSSEIRSLIGGRGVRILSTSKGVVAGDDAKKMKVGGELLCEVY